MNNELRQKRLLDWEPLAGQSLRPSRPGTLCSKSIADCSFSRWLVGECETGNTALNEWPLLGARIASLNVQVWAELPGSAGLVDPQDDIQQSLCASQLQTFVHPRAT